ncbi:Conserved hypothetical protein 2001 [hydrothermal vent metagenome]|uniref:Uncharacterized protein n=1 Tax=hydrothermal vent metagenome TaxID=652676 RepID=A0A3B1BA07_9ZZZZ
MSIHKLTLACGAFAMMGVSSMAIAEEAHQFSANVALSSDYIWRGISQTDNGPAISGGFDYAHSSGFYAGVWASNVDFGAGDDSNIEIDVYGGYGGEFKGVSFDVGILHYDYASESNNDFEEVYLGLGYGFLGVMVSYSDDGFNESGDATYYEANADFELPLGVGLGLHVGRYELEEGAEDYTDWKIALSREYQGFGFELAYTDTDLSDTDCGDDTLCDAHGVFTVSKEF